MDITERLRDRASHYSPLSSPSGDPQMAPDCELDCKAADMITTLLADNERLREALEKIANPLTYHDTNHIRVVALPTSGRASQSLAHNTLKALSPNTKDTPDDTADNTTE